MPRVEGDITKIGFTYESRGWRIGRVVGRVRKSHIAIWPYVGQIDKEMRLWSLGGRLRGSQKRHAVVAPPPSASQDLRTRQELEWEPNDGGGVACIEGVCITTNVHTGGLGEILQWSRGYRSKYRQPFGEKQLKKGYIPPLVLIHVSVTAPVTRSMFHYIA